VHRVLEISHTFTYYYLKDKMSFEEMMKSTQLIDEAMSSTITMFRYEEALLNTKKPINTTKSTSNVAVP